VDVHRAALCLFSALKVAKLVTLPKSNKGLIFLKISVPLTCSISRKGCLRDVL
jgi:hypothetical protein